MNAIRSIACCALLMMLSAGCGIGSPQYRAHAKVQVNVEDPQSSQALIATEMQVLRDLAPSFVSVDERFEVRHHANTSLIGVSVTTSDPQTAADACNRIVEKYVGQPDAPVLRKIIEQAVVPEHRI